MCPSKPTITQALNQRKHRKNGDHIMETLVSIVKYTFVIAAGIEVALLLRAIVVLALGKARTAALPAPAAEE